MIRPPHGLSGTSEAPITIRALNDGKVLINGQGSKDPVRLYENDWFVILGNRRLLATGMRISSACGSSSRVSSHNAIRRVAAWDAGDNNTEIFGAHNDSSK